MEKRIIVLLCLTLLATVTVFADQKKKGEKRTVRFLTTIECESCAKKVTENVSFEKGVWDLKVNVPDSTVTIIFNDAKTDTATLAKAIRALGYDATVKEYK